MVVDMDIAAIVERVEHITAVRRDASADGDQIQAGLVSVRQLQAWCDAQHAGLVTQLRGIDSFPEKRIADASKRSLGHATKSTERATTLTATPKLTEALTDGTITADHVDAVTRASKKLDGAQRNTFIDRADQLTAIATAGTVTDFARRLDLEAKKLQQDDGIDRLERQRRNARARSWVDLDGMWNLSAKFDPVTGVRIASRIDTVVESLFGEAVPDECPTDPIEKQRYLAAQAVARLLLDNAMSSPDAADETRPPARRPAQPTKPEYVAVIDADAPDQTGPVAEFSIPVEIPARILAELAGDADTHAIIVRNGIILHAPGQLDLGRTTRLANRAQRRALRGLYKHCAIPGCTVAYDRCKLHHIIWWTNGGPHRPRQPVTGVLTPPHQDPPRRLDHRTRTPPRTHPHPPRRQHPHHRPTPTPTTRRLIRSDRASEEFETSSPPKVTLRCVKLVMMMHTDVQAPR